MQNFSSTSARFFIRSVFLASCLSLFTFTLAADAGAISPKTVVATKTNGIKTIAGMRVNGGPLNLADVRGEFGAPDRTKRTSPSTCDAFYSGIRFIFTSFGGETTCGSLFLQSAVISKHAWKVKVGKKVYRVGQSDRRIPNGAKKFPFYGYRLATMPFIGSRTGTVFARVKNNRISALPLFIGGAGD
ncbi:MAG: hypothetical protein JJE13_12060 [Thermoleophilia bacterium]|nr:hypothetical protein [Thermoleophilia bacterium]